MILANFDLSFFTSIPGMLITGGVLLLLIALIIFIVTGNKDKKKKKDEVKNEVSDTSIATPSVDVAVTTEEVVSNLNQVNPTVETPTVTTPPVNTTIINGNPTVNNSTSSTDEGLTPSTAEPIAVVSSENSVTSDNNISSDVQTGNSEVVSVDENKSFETPTPVITPTVNQMSTEEVKPVVSSTPTPNVIPTVEPVVSGEQVSVNKEVETPVVTVAEPPKEVEPVQQVEEHKAIYGGVSSVIPNINVDNNPHRPIYGGADPLENTQSIPTVNSTTVNAPKVEAEPVIPKVEQVQVPSNATPVDTTDAKKEEEVESLF